MYIRVLGEFGPTSLVIELAASKVMEIADYILIRCCEGVKLNWNIMLTSCIYLQKNKTQTLFVTSIVALTNICS